ncbi:hypothetical protein C7271_00735 [filamentous cyanobacterium CCP5]|nr:hypothetical protein C7271_00735 [filamentous cyanobacterium CCP5]
MSRDALIVGINQYKHLPALTAPAADAEAVSQRLERWGEFRVHRLPEAIKNGAPTISDRTPVTARALEQALIKLFKPSGKNIPQTALFYYSGHGLQRHAGIREGFLATSDADPEQGKYGVSLFWLRRLLQESPVKQRVIILDCCHSGELLNFLEADPGACDGTDRLFMAASREYESAYESLNSPNSVFTQAFLKGLEPHSIEGGVVNNHHLIKVVSQQLKGEIQQPLFESSGSSIILTRASGAMGAIYSPAKTIVERLQQLKYRFCPFQGLVPFKEEHGPYFFGREAATSQLVNHTHQSRICTLVGPSSSGKTSLLQAGLMYQLRKQTKQPWQIHYLTPGLQPLRRLATIFTSPQANDVQQAEQIYQAESFLRSNPAGLGALIQSTLGKQLADPSQRLLIVVDQLEELWSEAISEQDRAQFCSCLEILLQSPNLPIHIVLGVRSDTLSRIKTYPTLFSQATEHRLDLAPMTYEEVKTTIIKPLEKLGLEYDANLVYTLLLDTAGAPGELTLLQQLLRKLWQERQVDPTGEVPPRLTLDAYAALGNLREMLNQKATQIYQDLSKDQQAVARHIFLNLTEPGAGTEDRRRKVSIQQLVTKSFTKIQIEAVLEQLAQARLVVLDYQPVSTGERAWNMPSSCHLPEAASDFGHENLLNAQALYSSGEADIVVDITHESLIRTWPLLREWLVKQRPALLQQRRLEAAALEWHSHNRPSHPEYLLRGQILQAVSEFQQKQGQELSVLAEEYIHISLKAAQQRRLKRWAIRCLVPLSLGVGMLSAYGYYSLNTRVVQQDSPLGTSHLLDDTFYPYNS